MPPKKASAELAAAIPKQPDTERKHTKPEVSEDSGSKAAGRKVSHPSTMEMVTAALKALDSRKGVSAQAIRGFITEKHASVDEKRLKFMITAKTKAKEAKTQAKENPEPNIQTAKAKKVKTLKDTSGGNETEKPKKKKQATDDVELKTPATDDSALKVVPAKKPKTKNAAGEGGTEPKPSKAKKPKASKTEGKEAAAAKKGKKTAVKSETGGKTAVKSETGGKTAVKSETGGKTAVKSETGGKTKAAVK